MAAVDVLDTKPSLTEASRHWLLESSEIFLNHGSHGACPLPVLAKQRSLQGRIERNPIAFFSRDGEGLLDGARRKLATFVGADPANLVFVPNATTGVNTVLQSLLRPSDGWPGWQRGDEILTTDHCYGACRNALEALGAWTGVKIVVAPVPMPLASPGQVIEALKAHTTAQTKLLLIDAVTSPTALVMPVAEVVAQWQRSRGIDVLIDGAHGPGMVPLNLEMLGAAYYVGNGHKWLCAPKGSGFLAVRGDRHGRIRPLVISHGATDPRGDRGERSRLWLEFDWTGTDDPTPWLCMPEAIAFMGQLLDGGWDDLMQHNRTLATEARRWLEDRWGIGQSVGPESTTGAMASILLPDLASRGWSARSLQAVLFDRYQIEVPVIEWQLATADAPVNLLRISAQLYNHMPQYQYLGEAVAQLLEL